MEQVSIFAPAARPADSLECLPTPQEPESGPWPRGGLHLVGARDYQRAAIDAVIRELHTHRSTLMVMATGLGKTFTAGALVRGWRGKVLWLAHRDELIDQAIRELERLTGEEVSREQAQSRGGGTRIVVGSVATMRGKRLQGWAKDRFSLIIYDEAHHSVAKSNRAIVEHFAAAKVVGLTATPNRGDKKALGRIFQSVACTYDIRFGIDEGYLVPVKIDDTDVLSVNLAGAKTIAGDVDGAAVEEAIAKIAAPIAAKVHAATWAGERSLTFTPRVASAHAVAAALCAFAQDSAHAIDGTTDAQVRRHKLKGHRSNEYQHLVNCLVFTEGYDDPGVEVGCIARPTKSLGLFLQMLGRFLRPLPGIGELPTREERRAAIAASAKPRAVVINIAGNRHDLVTVLDALGGDYNDKERALAKKLLAGKSGDADEALADARAKLAAKAAAADKRRLASVGKLARDAKVSLHSRLRDPFVALGVDPIQGPGWPQWAHDPVSAGQLEQLKGLGIKPPGECTRGQANKLLLAAAERRRKGLASYKMVKRLAQSNCAGIDATNMPTAVAVRLMAAWRVGRFKRLSPDVVAQITGEGRQPGED